MAVRRRRHCQWHSHAGPSPESLARCSGTPAGGGAGRAESESPAGAPSPSPSHWQPATGSTAGGGTVLRYGSLGYRRRYIQVALLVRT